MITKHQSNVDWFLADNLYKNTHHTEHKQGTYDAVLIKHIQYKNFKSIVNYLCI